VNTSWNTESVAETRSGLCIVDHVRYMYIEYSYLEGSVIITWYVGHQQGIMDCHWLSDCSYRHYIHKGMYVG